MNAEIKKMLEGMDGELSEMLDNTKMTEFASEGAYADFRDGIVQAISGIRCALRASAEMWED